MPNYNNGKIYKLVNSVDNEIYIGSTCDSLSKRKYQHKAMAVKRPNIRVYQHLNTIGWENVRIILIESVQAFNKDQLRAREQHYIDLLKPTLNSQSAINNCPHGRQQSVCKPCGGSQICQHNRIRNQCKECGGSQICQHNRRRNQCKECGGVSICQHNRIRNVCKECGGSQICQHNRQRSQCKECGGVSICQHNRQRTRCKECIGDTYYCFECETNFNSQHSLDRHMRSDKHKKIYIRLMKDVFDFDMRLDEVPNI